jgi:hypothetical protein
MGKNIPLKNEKSMLHWGVFQHFDYYDSNFERQQVNSYRIAEAAALGVGRQYRRTSKRNTQFFFERLPERHPARRQYHRLLPGD